MSTTTPETYGANSIKVLKGLDAVRKRPGMLRDVSDALARHKLNVTAVQTQSRDLEASMRFTLEVRQVNDLPRVLASLGDIKGVLSVTRL